jgi:aminopeptidase N
VLAGKQVLKYSQAEHRLRIDLPATKASQVKQIAILYHGTPRRGIRFFPERSQVYTVFSTSQWMICNDDPDERATLRTRLILPADLTGVANGRFMGSKPTASGKTEHEWRQDRPVPSYTFGFAAGRFRKVTSRYRSGARLSRRAVFARRSSASLSRHRRHDRIL